MVEDNIVRDGFCDDIANTLACNYDNGDCCGPNVDKTYCNTCTCLGCPSNTYKNDTNSECQPCHANCTSGKVMFIYNFKIGCLFISWWW